jgi:membrane protease YdiL (CAAX protease family)
MTKMNETQLARRAAADWSAVMFAMIFPSFVTWVYFVWLKQDAASVQQAAYGIGKVLQFAFPLFWVLLVQRQRIAIRRPDRQGMGWGLVTGVAIVGAMFLLYHGFLKSGDLFTAAVDPIRDKVAGFGLDRLWKYASLGVFYALAHSLLEEYYWRWFVFGQLRRLAPVWVAVIVSSLGFMAHHVILLSAYFGWGSFASLFFSFSVCVGGVIWAWLYHRSGSLYGPWLSHALVDAGIFLLGYGVVRDMFV